MKFWTSVGAETFTFSLQKNGDHIVADRNGEVRDISIVPLSTHSYSVLINGKSHYLGITEQPDGYKVDVGHRVFPVQVKDEIGLLLERIGMVDQTEGAHGEIRAPIPGLVSRLFVKPGQSIRQGDKLLILEAMKMENEIRSPISGVVEDVFTRAGQSTDKDAPLLTIAPENHADR